MVCLLFVLGLFKREYLSLLVDRWSSRILYTAFRLSVKTNYNKNGCSQETELIRFRISVYFNFLDSSVWEWRGDVHHVDREGDGAHLVRVLHHQPGMQTQSLSLHPDSQGCKSGSYSESFFSMDPDLYIKIFILQIWILSPVCKYFFIYFFKKNLCTKICFKLKQGEFSYKQM